MLSGVLDSLTETKSIFDTLLVAQSQYIDIGTVETKDVHACFITEKDITRGSISETYWGQTIVQPQYEQVKKDILNWSLQSILIERKKIDGSIEIKRNHQADCGIFLLASKNKLHLHWDPVELYPFLDRSDLVDIEACLSFLELQLRYSARTVFKNIAHLPERGTATFKNGQLAIIHPQHIDPPTPVTLKDNVDPIEVFHELIRKNISLWPIDSETVGTILSSGLDTTIVAHLLSEKVAPQRLRSFGYSMISEHRDAIKAMRMETVDKLGLLDFYPLIEQNFEESYSLKSGKWWPEQTQTDFAEVMLARQMVKCGVTLAFTGIGGDELCTLSSAERLAMTAASAPSSQNSAPLSTTKSPDLSFISERFVSNLPSSDQVAWPNGYVGFSSPYMASGVGLFFLRKGIWFANPLGLANLHMFTNFLPVEWRYKRRLSREALTRLGYSANFTNQLPKEGLGETMDALMMGRDWEKTFKDAIILDLGLIDREKLLKGAEIFRNTKNVKIGIRLMTALHLELGLRSIH